MSPSERYLWGTVVPCAAVALAIALLIPALLVPAASPVDATAIISTRAFRSHPEPREQLRYVLAVVVVPTVLWCAAIRGSRAALLPPAMVRLAFVLFVVAAAAYYELRVTPLFGWKTIVVAAAGYGLLAALAMRRRRGGDHGNGGGWIPGLLAAATVATYVLPSIYREGMRQIDLHVWLHLPIALGEPAAVWAGRTPLVDYVPQYQLLLSYLLLPVCRMFGPSVTTLTTSAACLCFVGLLLVYGAFRRLAGNRWVALLLFLPFVGLSFMPLRPALPPERLTAFTYFAVGPLRVFGPWVALGALSAFLERPSAGRRLLAIFVATMAALNNLDFGLPALVGTLVAIAFCETGTLRPSVSRVVGLAATLAAAVATSILLLTLVSFVRTGQWPDLSQLVFYQRAYALLGYMMLPLPPFGFHWVLFLTHMAAIAQGLLGNPRARLRNGMLLFAGIFGAGATAYYIGRSHPEVLILVLSPWALTLAVLTFAAFDDVRHADTPATAPFQVTSVLIGTAWLLGLWQLHDMPTPWSQVARIQDIVPPVATEPVVTMTSCRSWAPAARTKLIDIVRGATHPGDHVAIIYPFGHVLAHDAGVQNVYRYTDDESLVLVAQVDDLMRGIEAHGVRNAFGRLSAPITAALAALGFHEKKVLFDFAWWSRDAR